MARNKHTGEKATAAEPERHHAKPVGQITGRPRPGAGKWEDREPYVKDLERGGR